MDNEVEFNEDEWTIQEFGQMNTKVILMSGGGLHVAGINFSHDEVVKFAQIARAMLDAPPNEDYSIDPGIICTVDELRRKGI